MAYVLCLKDTHLISRSGRSLHLKASLDPQRVPDQCVWELISRGCAPCNEQGQILISGTPFNVTPVVEKEPEPAPEVEVEPTREDLIDAAVKVAIEEGPEADISLKTGLPKVGPVSHRVGFKVNAEEVRKSVKRLGY